MLNCNENSTNAESGETLNLDDDLLYDVDEYGESGLVSDPIESIVSWLDATMVSEWPVLVTVHAYRRKKVNLANSDVVDFLQTFLDENYGCDDIDGVVEIPEVVKAAAARLAELTSIHCQSLAFDPSPKENLTFCVASVVREHCHHWLNEAEVAAKVQELESSGAEARP